MMGMAQTARLWSLLGLAGVVGGTVLVGCLVTRETAVVAPIANNETPRIVAAQAHVHEPPPFSLGEQPLHLGYILLGETFITELELKNEGDQDFTIAKIVTGCPCSTAEAMNTLVPAHGSTTILFEHDPDPFVHKWNKTLRIKTHERPNHWYTAVIQANCGYAVRLNRGGLQAIVSQKGNITAESIDGRPFRITSMHGAAPVVENFDPATDEPRSEYIVQYDLGDAGAEGRFGVALVMETDHPAAPMVALRINDSELRRSYDAEPIGWRTKDEYVLADTLPTDGSWIERTFTLRRTRTEEGKGPELAVEMTPFEPGGEVRMEVELVDVVRTPKSKSRGEYDVTVRIRAREGASPGFAEETMVISQREQFTQLPVYGRVSDPAVSTPDN